MRRIAIAAMLPVPVLVAACSSSMRTVDALADTVSDASIDPGDRVLPSEDGFTDAIDPDAGASAPCVELGAIDPWANRLGLHSLDERGTILSCVHAASIARDQVTASPYFAAHGWVADNGYELFVIQYVSEGSPGEPRAITALVYAPQTTAGNVPIAVVDHATSGMGPSCGPTHATVVADYMALPLVGHGYAVVATDYAGMGVDDGMTSYGVGDEEGTEAVDALRALLHFRDRHFDATQLGQDVFVLGHSQGGQAALFTQQLFDSTLPVSLLGTVAFAPGFGDLRGFGAAWNTAYPTTAGGVLIAMGLYADMLDHHRADTSTWLMPAAASSLPTLLHDQCLTQLLVNVPSEFPTEGTMFTPSFIAAAQSCDFRAACPNFEPWADDLAADVPGALTSAAPVLLVQGERDTTVAPAQTSCVRDRLVSRGTPVQACGYAGSDHLSVPNDAMPDVLRWMSARRAGETLDVCPAPIAEPCPP